VAALRPVVTDGHLALAAPRDPVAGEYWVSLNNYVNLSVNMKLAGNPIDVWAPRSGHAVLRARVGVNAKAPQSRTPPVSPRISCSARNASSFLAKFGRLPTAQGCAVEPAGRNRDADAEESHHGPDEPR